MRNNSWTGITTAPTVSLTPGRTKGYAVSIVEAGLTAVSRDGGRVRPPLTDLTEGNSRS